MLHIRVSFQTAYSVVSVMLLLLNVAPIAAQNTAMEVDGDQTVKKTATVNENLKVNTSSSPGTPNFITGNNGDLYVKDQLEVDGNTNMAGYLAVDTNVLYVSASYNSVAIGSGAGDTAKFKVGGVLSLFEVASHPEDDLTFAKLYSKDVSLEVEMFAMNEFGTFQQLTSHADPAWFDPGFASSFSDTSVAIPFSVHHGNRYIGKGGRGRPCRSGSRC